MKFTWQIGDVEFTATDIGNEWEVVAFIGGLEIFEPNIMSIPIERILNWSSFWVQEYTRKLFTEAINFSPSDVL